MSGTTHADRLLNSGLGRWLVAAAPDASVVDGVTIAKLADGGILCDLARDLDHRIIPRVELGDTDQSGSESMGHRRLSAVLEAVVTFYQDVLSTVVLMELPIVPLIVHDPESSDGVEHLRRLLLLLLGCAVGGCNRQHHIALIQSFDAQLQYSVKEVLEDGMRSQLRVGVAPHADEKDLGDALHTAHQCLVQALAERDEYAKDTAMLKLSCQRSGNSEAEMMHKLHESQRRGDEWKLEAEETNGHNADLHRDLDRTASKLSEEGKRCQQLQTRLAEALALQVDFEAWRDQAEERSKATVPRTTHEGTRQMLDSEKTTNIDLKWQNELLQAEIIRLNADHALNAALETKLETTETAVIALRAKVEELQAREKASEYDHRSMVAQLERDKSDIEQELRQARVVAEAAEAVVLETQDLAEEMAELKTTLRCTESSLAEYETRFGSQLKEVVNGAAPRKPHARKLPRVPAAKGLPVHRACQTESVGAGVATSGSRPRTPLSPRSLSPRSLTPFANRLGNLIRNTGENAAYCASPPLRWDGNGVAAVNPLTKIKWDDVMNAPGSPLAKQPLREIQPSRLASIRQGKAPNRPPTKSKKPLVKLSSKHGAKQASTAESRGWDAINLLDAHLNNVRHQAIHLNRAGKR